MVFYTLYVLANRNSTKWDRFSGAKSVKRAICLQANPCKVNSETRYTNPKSPTDQISSLLVLPTGANAISPFLLPSDVSNIRRTTCYDKKALAGVSWLTQWNAVKPLRDTQGVDLANSKMASFITTMFVSPPFPNISLKPLPAVSTPIHIAPFRTSLAIRATLYAAAMKQPKRAHGDEDLGLPHDVTRNARTRGQFKPKHANKGTSSYQLRQFAEATLGSGSLRKAVKLPEGEDLSEWLAVNSKEKTEFA